jgi:yersiniabactin nonribosomal peptide synthetase
VHPDIDHILGDFTSLLLAAHAPRPGDRWLGLVRRFQEQVWSGMEHNAVSAIWVLRELARRLGEPAVSMPVVFTSALGVSDELAGLRLPFGEQVWGISQTPQVWLDCQVMEREGGLYANWDVVEELFPEGVIDGMFAAFSGLLEWLVAADWSSGLPELMPEPQRAVRAQVNDVPGPLSGRLLHEGFFAWAAREPERQAVVGERIELSYGQVAEAALRLGGALRAAGVGAGDAVGVCLSQGAAQVVAVLGVLAAGGVYVPVGVDQPPVRRARIFERAGVRAAIGHPGAELGTAVRLVPLSDADLGTTVAVGPEPLEKPLPVADESPAYVIFTSGSTGEPKGVEVPHRAAVNTIEDVCGRFGVDSGDRSLAVSALDFDLSVFDVFGLLAVGGTVVLIGEDQRRDPHAWLELVRAHGVTVWNTVPALLDMLLAVDARSDLGALRLALVSGDWVGLDLRERLVARSPGARLIALGGATEAAIWSNFFEVTEVPEGWRSIPYGRPLRNQRFRVVDERGRDRPDWAVGELWIGGAGVALGYRGDPERTAERFVEHAGVRWYRTGDLGRYWPDGTLEFLGREDHQVKVGGHRIELGEIEAALAGHPGVGDAVVVKVGDPARLAAVVVGEAASADGLPDFLRDRLPPYMIPQQVQPVASLPLSANGKVDRAAIERLFAAGADDAGAEPPREGREDELAALWNGLLTRQVTDRRQSFFALGGDSLLATRMVEAVRDRYGVEIPLRELFARPALADLAATIEEQLKDYEEGEL